MTPSLPIIVAILLAGLLLVNRMLVRDRRRQDRRTRETPAGPERRKADRRRWGVVHYLAWVLKPSRRLSRTGR